MSRLGFTACDPGGRPTETHEYEKEKNNHNSWSGLVVTTRNRPLFGVTGDRASGVLRWWLGS